MFDNFVDWWWFWWLKWVIDYKSSSQLIFFSPINQWTNHCSTVQTGVPRKPALACTFGFILPLTMSKPKNEIQQTRPHFILSILHYSHFGERYELFVLISSSHTTALSCPELVCFPVGLNESIILWPHLLAEVFSPIEPKPTGWFLVVCIILCKL